MFEDQPIELLIENKKNLIFLNFDPINVDNEEFNNLLNQIAINEELIFNNSNNNQQNNQIA